MTREENLHWIDEEIRTWENECQSKHPIKEALYAARKALEQEPCEDAVSRKSVITIIQNHWWNCRDIDKLVNELPPVTPQEPNTWSLDDAREDFMHDVYNALDFLPTNEEANCIIDIFDRVTSSIEQAPRKGHWVTRPHVFGVAYCSECGFELKIDNTIFCPNCGADMREDEE